MCAKCYINWSTFVKTIVKWKRVTVFWTTVYKHIQAKLNTMKLKPGLGAFYNIHPGNRLHLFSSSLGLARNVVKQNHRDISCSMCSCSFVVTMKAEVGMTTHSQQRGQFLAQYATPCVRSVYAWVGVRLLSLWQCVFCVHDSFVLYTLCLK